MVEVTYWFIVFYDYYNYYKSEKRNKDKTIKVEKKNVEQISDSRLTSLYSCG